VASGCLIDKIQTPEFEQEQTEKTENGTYRPIYFFVASVPSCKMA
jgi:hypothetical protein